MNKKSKIEKPVVTLSSTQSSAAAKYQFSFFSLELWANQTLKVELVVESREEGLSSLNYYGFIRRKKNEPSQRTNSEIVATTVVEVYLVLWRTRQKSNLWLNRIITLNNRTVGEHESSLMSLSFSWLDPYSSTEKIEQRLKKKTIGIWHILTAVQVSHGHRRRVLVLALLIFFLSLLFFPRNLGKEGMAGIRYWSTAGIMELDRKSIFPQTIIRFPLLNHNNDFFPHVADLASDQNREFYVGRWRVPTTISLLISFWLQW